MEQVKGYRADDGQMFDDKLKCMDHDLLIFFRSVVNDGKSRGMTPDLAMRTEKEHIYSTIQTYNKRVAAMRAAATRSSK